MQSQYRCVLIQTASSQPIRFYGTSLVSALLRFTRYLTFFFAKLETMRRISICVHWFNSQEDILDLFLPCSVWFPVVCFLAISVKCDKVLAHKQIGYCPQFDALDDHLTVEEHLSLYALLRGIPAADCQEVSVLLLFSFGSALFCSHQAYQASAVPPCQENETVKNFVQFAQQFPPFF